MGPEFDEGGYSMNYYVFDKVLSIPRTAPETEEEAKEAMKALELTYCEPDRFVVRSSSEGNES